MTPRSFRAATASPIDSLDRFGILFVDRLVQQPDALVLLGQVDQVEVGGEGRCHGTRLAGCQSGDFLLQPQGGFMMGPVAAGLGLGPDAFFGVEDGGRFQFREDLAEQVTEQVDGL